MGWLWSFDLHVMAIPNTLTGCVHVLALWPICTSARSMTGDEDEGNYSWLAFGLGMLPQSCMKVRQALNISPKSIIQTKIFRKCVYIIYIDMSICYLRTLNDANVFAGAGYWIYLVYSMWWNSTSNDLTRRLPLHECFLRVKRYISDTHMTTYGGHRSSFNKVCTLLAKKVWLIAWQQGLFPSFVRLEDIRICLNALCVYIFRYTYIIYLYKYMYRYLNIISADLQLANAVLSWWWVRVRGR